MTSVADDLVDAAMFAMHSGFLYGSATKPSTVSVPSHTHTLAVTELPVHSHAVAGLPPHTYGLASGGALAPCTHEFVSGITGTLARAPTQTEVAAIESGLRAMIAQIEADRKARPVHAAIDATHRAFRSDGRPHHYHDPLLDD